MCEGKVEYADGNWSVISLLACSINVVDVEQSLVIVLGPGEHLLLVGEGVARHSAARTEAAPLPQPLRCCCPPLWCALLACHHRQPPRCRHPPLWCVPDLWVGMVYRFR